MFPRGLLPWSFSQSFLSILSLDPHLIALRSLICQSHLSFMSSSLYELALIGALPGYGKEYIKFVLHAPRSNLDFKKLL